MTQSDNDRVLWCGNVGDRITEELLYELFLQAGPLEGVKIPSDKEGRKRNFGFISFKHACSVSYAMKLLNGIRLHGRTLNLQFRPGSVHMTSPRGGQQFSPSPEDRGFNGSPGYLSRMMPPPMMQPLMSPAMHRSWSTPIMQQSYPEANPAQDESDQRFGRSWSREGRDRSRDGTEHRDRSHDNRGRDRDQGRHGRHRDRDYSRGRDRDYRNPSQDRNNDGLRRGDTFHGFPSPQMGGPPPGLMGSGSADRDADHRRPQQSQQRAPKNLPPWQRPY